MMCYVGIDTSLHGNNAVARLTVDDSNMRSRIDVKWMLLRNRVDVFVAEELEKLIRGADLILVESPTLAGSNSDAANAASEWLDLLGAIAPDTRVRTIDPRTWQRVILGPPQRGRTTKDQSMAMAKVLTNVEIGIDDIADAICIAWWGYIQSKVRVDSIRGSKIIKGVSLPPAERNRRTRARTRRDMRRLRSEGDYED